MANLHVVQSLKAKNRIIVLLTAALFCFSLLTIAHAADVKAPSMIKLSTYDVGSSAYMMYGFVGEAMIKRFGVQLRAIPAGNDIARMISLRLKQVDFAGQGGDMYYAVEGLDRYAEKAWGPQPLRMVWMARNSGQTGIVRGDSGIKSWADIKGKKLPYIPGSVFTTIHEGFLAFAGLTWKDVKKVPVSGFGTMMSALADGKIDLACASVNVPPAYELQSGPHGVYFLPVPATDKAGWERLTDVVPFLSPFKASVGPTLSKEHPVEVASYAYPVTLCYDFLDDDTAYFMTKAIHQCYPEMAPRNDSIKNFWSLEECLSLYEPSKGYIFHNGSVRYLKEIGVWKPEWDQIQQKRLERQNALKALWEKTVAEAKEKSISDNDFLKFWLGKRSAVFKESY